MNELRCGIERFSRFNLALRGLVDVSPRFDKQTKNSAAAPLLAKGTTFLVASLVSLIILPIALPDASHAEYARKKERPRAISSHANRGVHKSGNKKSDSRELSSSPTVAPSPGAGSASFTTIVVLPISYRRNTETVSIAPSPSPTSHPIEEGASQVALLAGYSSSVVGFGDQLPVSRLGAASQLALKVRTEFKQSDITLVTGGSNPVGGTSHLDAESTRLRTGACSPQYTSYATAKNPLAWRSFTPRCDLTTRTFNSDISQALSSRAVSTVELPTRSCEVSPITQSLDYDKLDETSRTGIYVYGDSNVRYLLEVKLKVWGLLPSSSRTSGADYFSTWSYAQLLPLRPLDVLPTASAPIDGPLAWSKFSGTIFGIGIQGVQGQFSFVAYDPVTQISTWRAYTYGNSLVDVTPSARSNYSNDSTSIDCFGWSVVAATIK